MTSGPTMDPGSIDLLDALALERCALEGTLDRVLSAWSARLADPGAGGSDRAARLALLRALRLDLPLLARDPSLLFACVYNRVSWHDTPEAAAFHGVCSGAGEPVTPPPPPGEPATSWSQKLRSLLGIQPAPGEGTEAQGEPASASPLRDWAERWRRDRRTRGAAAPWARALRPPEHPLDGPLLEEYRDDLPGAGALRFSADGAALGVIVAGAGSSVAWDRRTGRRLDEDAIARAFPVASAAPPWALERADWGHCRVRDPQSGALIVDAPVDEDSSLGELAVLPGGAVLVAGWRGDYDGVVFRLDPPYRSPTWCAEVGGSIDLLAPSASGALLAAADGSATHLLDAATGRVLGRAPGRAQRIALDPAGALLAVASGDLLRVWDVTSLLARGAPSAHPCDAGFVAAAFSPDGRRLLTGELLCDARDGRPIARLHLDGPGYLEGGPPADGRLLANDRYVEVAPLRGVCVWETAGGRRVVRDQARRYGGRHVLVIAPDGLHYAVTEMRFGEPNARAPLTLHRTDDGHLCARLGDAAPHALRFAPDATWLVSAAGADLSAWRVPGGEPMQRFPHPAPITDAAVSRDGALLLTGARDGVLRLWEVGGARIRAERPLDGDPVQSSWTSTEGTTTAWRATPEALERVEGWRGFSTIAHPFTTRRRGGLLEIVERDGGRVHARVVTHLDLVADPTGTRWACRAAHVAIEDG